MAAQSREDQYYEVIHKKTWSRRTAGFLGAATLFAGLGAGVGAVAYFMPPLLAAVGFSVPTASASLSVVGIASNMALFGAVGSFLGLAGGGDVGASSGAAAAGVEETEKLLRAAGAKIPEKPLEPKKPTKLLNWKVALATGAICAVFGALIALSPISASTVALMGFAPGSTAASITSAVVLGMYGAMLGVNVPALTHEFSAGYRKLLKGKFFEKESATESALSQVIETQKSIPTQEISAEIVSEPNRASFASKAPRATLANILDKSEQTPESSLQLR